MNNKQKIIDLEKKLSVKLSKQLWKNKKELENILKQINISIYKNNKEIIDHIILLNDNNNIKIVDLLVSFIWTVIKLWFYNNKKILKEYSNWLKIDLNDSISLAWKYLKRLKNIHLSDYKWSISNTTNKRIKKLLYKWLKEWMSYTEIAKNINKLDWLVFSKARWEIIAITEIWRAYEYWNWIVVKEIKKKHNIKFEKKALTAEDNKVRPEHVQNWLDWWIKETDEFSWTHTKYANTWFRCRCTTLYRPIKNNKK